LGPIGPPRPARLALALLALCAPLPFRAAEPAADQAPAPIPAAPSVDPEAVAAIRRMGEYLGTLRAFAVHAETTTDVVLAAGAKVQYQGWFDLTARWPDRLRVSFQRDGKGAQEYFYDGTSLTVWIKARNLWASIPAPPTIAELIEVVRMKYDLEVPLADFLLDAARKQILQEVTAGIVIGPSRVRGVECEHYGFHQVDVDWQIWIARGDPPLPRKYLITTLGEPSQPQHGEYLTWDLSPTLDDATFTFVPPAGARRIVFAEGARPTQTTAAKSPAPEGSNVSREGSR
jgi:hypothetical protein